MKPITRILSLSLALALPLCASAEDDSRRWVEDITKLTSIPMANEARLDADFARTPISHSGDVASAALAWAEADILRGGVQEALMGDLSLFIMRDDVNWHATLTHGNDTVLLTLDVQGRLISYQHMDSKHMTTYEHELLDGADEAILSYIEHFARMNGCERVTNYQRQSVLWDGSTYDAHVTASAKLDGTLCTFTISLETMGFTRIDCPLPYTPPLLMTTPVPAHMHETLSITLADRAIDVQVIDARSIGSSFSQPPADALSRETVITIGLQALVDQLGLSAEDLTAEPMLCGYLAESALAHWQLNFASPASGVGGYPYTVHIRDIDGAVLGVWTPEEGNG